MIYTIYHTVLLLQHQPTFYQFIQVRKNKAKQRSMPFIRRLLYLPP